MIESIPATPDTLLCAHAGLTAAVAAMTLALVTQKSAIKRDQCLTLKSENKAQNSAIEILLSESKTQKSTIESLVSGNKAQNSAIEIL